MALKLKPVEDRSILYGRKTSKEMDGFFKEIIDSDVDTFEVLWKDNYIHAESCRNSLLGCAIRRGLNLKLFTIKDKVFISKNKE